MHQDPSNRDVLGAARRVSEALQAQLQARSLVAQMLDTVRSPLAKIADDAERQRRSEALMGLVGLASQDPHAADDVLRESEALVVLLGREHEPEERLLAFRLLAACCAHPDFVQRAFGGGSTSAGAAALVRVLEQDEEDEDEDEDQEGKTVAEEGLVLVKITTLLRLLKVLGGVATEEGSRAATLVERALDCWTRALRHHTVCARCRHALRLAYDNNSPSHMTIIAPRCHGVGGGHGEKTTTLTDLV
jgi:hypothetical protein